MTWLSSPFSRGDAVAIVNLRVLSKLPSQLAGWSSKWGSISITAVSATVALRRRNDNEVGLTTCVFLNNHQILRLLVSHICG